MRPLICIRRVDQTAILNVFGDIDLASSPVVRKILMREVRENRTPIVVCNLAEVGYIDSSGIASLVEVFEIYKDENQALVSRNPRIGWKANEQVAGNRGGGHIGPGLDLDSCNPSVPRCLFYLACPFRGNPLQSGSCRLTSDGS